MNTTTSSSQHLKDPRSIVIAFLVIMVLLLLFWRTIDRATEIQINPAGCVKKAVSEISFLKNGEVAVSYNGLLIDPREYPLPDAVSKGKIVNFGSIALLATTGSPINVYVQTPSATYCYKIESTTGAYLGPC